VDETNGPIVGDGFRPLFLWNQHNVGGVEPMEVLGVEVGKKHNDSHKVLLDYVPTRFEKQPRKTIRTRSLAGILYVHHVPLVWTFAQQY
jgi:hypothetical protein